MYAIHDRARWRLNADLNEGNIELCEYTEPDNDTDAAEILDSILTPEQMNSLLGHIARHIAGDEADTGLRTLIERLIPAETVRQIRETQEKLKEQAAYNTLLRDYTESLIEKING